MKQLPLGRTDIMVSEWCLGTMTFGNQTPQDDAHTQIDMALDAGINFIDTAEMYPVNPIRAETVGLSEEIVGNWIAKTGRRDDVVIATKVSGNNPGWVREGRGYDGTVIREAIETSLKRLKTDVIDLYQMHWPIRGSYMFRQNWTYDPSGQNRQTIGVGGFYRTHRSRRTQNSHGKTSKRMPTRTWQTFWATLLAELLSFVAPSFQKLSPKVALSGLPKNS